MNKKLIRLSEQDLHKIVKESVNRIIKEDLNGNLKHKDLKFVRNRWYDDDSEIGVKTAFQIIRGYINDVYGYGAYPRNPRISQRYVDSLYSKLKEVEDAINPDSDLATAAANQNLNHYSIKNGKVSPTRFRSDDEEPEDWYERNEHGDFDEI